MAAASYEHVESPCIIDLDGVRAFNPGNAVPIETAERIGLLEKYPDLERIPARQDQGSRVAFRDVPIVVEESPQGAPATPTKPEPPKALRTTKSED